MSLSLTKSNASRNNQKRRPRRSRNSQVAALLTADRITHPELPEFQASHRYTKRLRFFNNAPITLAAYAIQCVDIANLLVVVGVPVTGSAIGYPIWSRYRIKTVEMWAIPSAPGIPVTISLQYLETSSSATNSEATKTDTSASISEYAHIKLAPPPGSMAAMWQTSTSQTGAFALSGPAGFILDLVLEVFISNDDTIPDPVPVADDVGTSSPPTPGTVILQPLDSNDQGEGYIIPLGYNTPVVDFTPTPRKP